MLATRHLISLKQGHLCPGGCVSANHCISAACWRLYSSLGAKNTGFTCGSLFVNHASGLIFNFCQHSTNTNSTIKSKRRLKAIAHNSNITINQYHSDIGMFASTPYKNAIKTEKPSTISKPSANGLAPTYSTRHPHWPSQISINLWPQALDYATWVFNQLPSKSHGLTPLEL
jgi:hypothetical protein